MRPWPAQSNNSRAPSVKKLCLRLCSRETYGRPPPRSRDSNAAVAGIGEALPTATCRTFPINRAMTSASSSSSWKPWLCGAALIHEPLEIVGETIRCRSHAGVFRKMICIGRIKIRQSERPRAALHYRDGFHIEPGEGAGREHRIVEKISVMNLFHGRDGFVCS